MDDRYEERAAIMEYDGGMTREEAEIEAYKDVYKNNNNKPVLQRNSSPMDCEDPFQDD
jgi:hypothetical protein